MPRGKPAGHTGRTLMLRELRTALDEADAVKAQLRKAKARVSAALRKLHAHVETHRARRTSK